MKVQVLVSAMHQTDHTLLEKMNIQTDAIVINQCDKNEFEEFQYEGKSIRFISFAERGVGLSRNNALMRATGDICLIADEDVTYVENYEDIIVKGFMETSKADVIVFNVPSRNPQRPSYMIPKKSRVRWFNCLRYGAVRIAARTEKLREANITFSLLFGGGAKYSAGEDCLFLADCIKKGLKVYANPTVIGQVSQEKSSWFQGYTNKFFIDKGALFNCLTRYWAKLLCLQFVVRHHRMFEKEKTIREACKLMFQGMKE
jgi:glycosyltransferase involved in cell wall biosynthesis